MYCRSERWPAPSGIVWCDQRRTLKIGSRVITLSPLEYQLFVSLRDGEPITYVKMAKQVYHCFSYDRKMRSVIDKHIDRIRGKLLGSGFYIFCIQRYGYVLLASDWMNENE